MPFEHSAFMIPQTEFAAWLTDLAAEVLKRWRALEDEAETQNCVVDCLRSMNARYRFHQKPITEFQDKFSNKEIDWNLAISKKINQSSTSTQITILILGLLRGIQMRSSNKSNRKDNYR